jgi:hypothetical protein
MTGRRTVWGVIVAVLGACGAAAALHAENAPVKRAQAKCKVEGAPETLVRAVCIVDGAALSNTAGALLADPAQAKATVRVLEKLWVRDTTLGEGLRWSDLNDEHFRSFVVFALALAVREGKSSVPVAPLQEFAVDYARKYSTTGITHGIDLIGRTDAPGQLPYLTVLASGPDREKRRMAIYAMGLMCEPTVGEYLEKLSMKPKALPKEDAELAGLRKRYRENITMRHYCNYERQTPAGSV